MKKKLIFFHRLTALLNLQRKNKLLQLALLASLQIFKFTSMPKIRKKNQ
jgi:hypothetical protein